MRHRGAASTGIVVRIAALVCGAAIAAAVWSASASAALQVTHPYLSSFGSFSDVQGVATDAAGDVYVFDGGTSTIFKFDAAGNPVNFTATGTNEITGVYAGGGSENEIAVDNTTGPTAGDIYVANGSTSEVQIFSPAGSSIGTLSPEAGIPWSGEACGVAVDPSGNVYIGTYAGQILKYTPTANPVTNADYSSSIGGADEPCNIAVDQAGNVFAETWSEGPITRYEPSQFGSSSAMGSIIDSKGSTLAVDPASQEVYVDEQSQVAQFGVHGEPVSTFAGMGEGAISGSFGIAVGPVNHEVYVSDGSGKLSVFGTAAGGHVPTVTTGSASEVVAGGATLNGSVNPEGVPISECFFEYGETTSYGKTAPCAESLAEVGLGNAPVAVHAKVTGLVGLTGDEYHFRLVAAQTVKGFGADSSFVALVPPAIEEAYVTKVTSTSATLWGDLNPRAHDTTYHFEYGTDTGYGSSTPDLDAGSSAASTPVAGAHLQGLTADTTYHYRLVATNVNGPAYGPDLTFTTQSAGGPLTMLDGRQWELVSPPVKNGAGIIPYREGGGVIQASESGDAISYFANNPIELEPEGNSAPEASQIMARRAPGGGWVNRTLDTANEDIHQLPVGVGLEYKMFSEDLARSILQPYGTTPLSLSATKERAPYLREEAACDEGSPSCFKPFLTRADTMPGAEWDPNPPDAVPGLLLKVHFQDATPDLSHSVFSSEVKLLEGAGEPSMYGGSGEEGLYEWSSDGRLQFVGINAAGEPAPGEFAGPRNGISSDGSRIVWCEERCGGRTPLLMRDTATEETLTIASGAGTSFEADFQAATEDGSKIFYTVEPTYPEKQLWECEVIEVGGKLKCAATEIAPQTLGLTLGINHAGTIVYFVSTSALAGDAEAGADNLYVGNLEGGKWIPRFIATLSSEVTATGSSGDAHDWGRNGGSGEALAEMTARVAPDGRYLAFTSNRSLTGYDNHDAVSGEPDQEVFLYDNQTGRLACASCNPTGARPDGVYMHFDDGTLVNPQNIWRENWVAATVPGWDNVDLGETLRQPRYLSDEGRLFFESSDGLVPQDTNGQQDVYEYEPDGAGNCTSAQGCVGLISGGKSGQEAVFLDASASGSDVFFITTARLTPQDEDTAFDVYDAHVCTSAVPCAQTAVSPSPCSNGESCKPAQTPQPSIFGAPASATFSGAGNMIPAAPKAATKSTPKAKPVKCKKGFVEKKKFVKKKKCVKKLKAKKAKKASNKRGADR